MTNTAGTSASSVDVEVTNAPAWLMFSTRTSRIGEMAGNEEKIATLTISVDKSVLIGQEQSLTVTVKASRGQSWTKEIKVKVSPPEKFELYPNYPNPFNPTTTICYQLTRNSKVSLKVYNLLGQEVMTLVDADQQAGYHQELFDATRHASGMYIYRTVYTNEAGKKMADRKSMLVVKQQAKKQKITPQNTRNPSITQLCRGLPNGKGSA